MNINKTQKETLATVNSRPDTKWINMNVTFYIHVNSTLKPGQ